MAAVMKEPFSVISSETMQRIQGVLKESEPTHYQLERENLRKMSKARAAKWPNTIDALRARKERERLERLDNDENERMKLDQETAVLSRSERRKQVERASMRLFEQTDRVKAFNSKLHLASVLKERENQIKYIENLKALQEQQAKDEEAKFHESINEMDGKVVDIVQKNWEMKQKLKVEKLEQLRAFSEDLIQSRMEEKREGEMLRKRAEEDDRLGHEQDSCIRRMSRQEEKIRQIRREACIESQTINLSKKNKTLEAKENEAKYEADIAAVARRKEEIELAKEAKVRERSAAIVQRRESRLAIQAKILQEADAARVAEIQKFEKEPDPAIYEAEISKRAESLKRRQDVFHRSRQQQVEIRRRAKEIEKQEEERFLHCWKVHDKRIKKHEAEKEEEKKLRGKAIQEHQLRKAAAIREKKDIERERDIEDAELTKELIAREDQMFEEYTKSCLDEAVNGGVPTKAMEIQLGKYHRLLKRGDI